MSLRLTVALHGVPGLRTLVERLEQLRRQTRRPDQILLLDGGGVARQLPRMGDAALHFSLPALEPVDVPTNADPSVCRDIGMRSSKADVVCFLEPGILLKDGYFERSLASMASDKTAFATSWWERVGPSGQPERFAPTSCDLPEFLARPSAVHRASLFRRTAWKKTGGFDTSLGAAEDYELCLRLLSEGWRGALVSDILVRQESSRVSSYQRELWRERYLPAMTIIFKKHRRLFEQRAADTLIGREEILIGLADQYRPMASRREAAVAELEGLNQEIERLALELGKHGRGRVDWGDLRRTSPISSQWGFDRGTPVDRYYIEAFLRAHVGDIRGRVLEVQEDDYARRFGGEKVDAVDVVDMRATNPRANVIADLRSAPGLHSESYDCIILTQTIHVIDDMEAVVKECYRLLKPGGKLLVTLPCVSRVCLEYGADGDYWRVTESGARQMFSAAFTPYAIETRVYGNVLAGTAFVYGLSCEEVTLPELDETDPYHPTLIGVCASRPAAKRSASRSHANGAAHGIILSYHGLTPAPHDPHGLFVEPRVFARQMAHLRQHYRPTPLADLVTGAQRGSLPPGAVAVTFDDGYRDALTTISPILVENEIPATFFVPTASLAGGSEHWWDLLARMFLSDEHPSRPLSIELGGKRRRFSFQARADSEKAYWTLHSVLMSSPLAERNEILRRLMAWNDLDPKPAVRKSMTAEEVKELAIRPGHAIGAHSVHHLALGHQVAETQQLEILESKATLERLPLTIEAFAYPYGVYNDETVRLVRAAGFRMAVTTEERTVPPRPDAYRLPRLKVKPGPISEFKRWLARRTKRPMR